MLLFAGVKFAKFMQNIRLRKITWDLFTRQFSYTDFHDQIRFTT